MITKISIKEFSKLITRSSKVIDRAIALSLIEIAQWGEFETKKNIKRNFTGRNGYTLSGALLNSTYNEFRVVRGVPTAFIGSRGVIYAKVHEQGKTIKNKNWKYLWIRSPWGNKKSNKFRRLAPWEFYNDQKILGDKSGFFYRGRAAMVGNRNGKRQNPLFFLVKQVKIPARPYLGPAADAAAERLPKVFKQWVNKLNNESLSKL